MAKFYLIALGAMLFVIAGCAQQKICGERNISCLIELSESPDFGSSVNFCMQLTDKQVAGCQSGYSSRSDCLINFASKTKDSKICDMLLNFNSTTHESYGCGAGKVNPIITLSPEQQYEKCMEAIT
jgi:hypothetical protein